jgi:hypothetical protein
MGLTFANHSDTGLVSHTTTVFGGFTPTQISNTVASKFVTLPSGLWKADPGSRTYPLLLNLANTINTLTAYQYHI